MDPRAVMWRSTVREAPDETRHASGKVDLKSLRSVSTPRERLSCSYNDNELTQLIPCLTLLNPTSLLYSESTSTILLLVQHASASKRKRNSVSCEGELI